MISSGQAQQDLAHLLIERAMHLRMERERLLAEQRRLVIRRGAP